MSFFFSSGHYIDKKHHTPISMKPKTIDSKMKAKKKREKHHNRTQYKETKEILDQNKKENNTKHLRKQDNIQTLKPNECKRQQ